MLKWRTSPDEKDNHVHEVHSIKPDGSGKTQPAGEPSHSHDVENYIIKNSMVNGYTSVHLGELIRIQDDSVKHGEPLEMSDDERTAVMDFVSNSMNGGGGFEGGFEGCVLRMMKVKDLPRERAEMVCSFIPKESKGDRPETAKEFKERTMKLGELKGVEIFATGTHRGRTFTKADLVTIAKNFVELKSSLKPPMVLGHDEKQEILDNSGLPSLGWATAVAVKDSGNGSAVLTADFDEVPDLARDAIKLGRYKRISSELYENFTDQKGRDFGLVLRRVALLGAAIPEVKTLADVVALGEPATSVVFADKLMDMPQPPPFGKKKEGDDDEDEEKKKAKKDEEKKMLKETEERLKKLEEDNVTLKKQNDELVSNLARETLEKHREKIASFCEKLKHDGKYLPKWDQMGLQKFMESLDSSKTVKFAEGKDAKESSPLAFLQEFLNSLPAVVRLGEMARIDPKLVAAAKAGAEAKGAALDIEARSYMAEQEKAGRKLSYAEAVREVAKAKPELVEA
jgi:hypothetical protein